jgi:hypothetical protein
MAFMDQLIANEYRNLMMDKTEDIIHHRLQALKNIKGNKARVARYYNKKVVPKQFEERELIWKLVLPNAFKGNQFGKWSPTKEGPYQISKCLPRNAYMLMELEEKEFDCAVNGKFLKKYYLSIWVRA